MNVKILIEYNIFYFIESAASVAAKQREILFGIIFVWEEGCLFGIIFVCEESILFGIVLCEGDILLIEKEKERRKIVCAPDGGEQ